MAARGGYDAATACAYISAQYIMTSSSSSSGYFGLRPGALCSSLSQCASLPASCVLKGTAAAPLLNVTGAIDMCSAEGVAAGSSLSGVVTVAGESLGSCLLVMMLVTA